MQDQPYRGHHYERNRAAKRADVDARPFNPRATTRPPTVAQLAFLRKLAVEVGQTFTMPRTSRQASARIEDMKALKRHKPTR